MVARLRYFLFGILMSFILLPSCSEAQGQSLPAIPTEAVSFACVTDGQKIYMLGGMSLEGNILASCSTYDTVDGKWYTISSMGSARVSAAAVYCNGRIYVFGGRNNQNILNSVEVYDIDENKWSYGKDMPYAAWEMTAEECNGSIYVMGGIQGTGDARKGLNNVYMFDPVQETWSQGTSLPSSRHTAASAVVGDTVYIIGGKEKTGANASAVDLVTRLDIKEMRWHALQPLPRPIVGAKAAVINNEIYMVGGSSRGSILSSILKYNESGDWTNIADLEIARYGHSVVAIENTLYVLGGVTVAPGSSGNMMIADQMESFFLGSAEAGKD